MSTKFKFESVDGTYQSIVEKLREDGNDFLPKLNLEVVLIEFNDKQYDIIAMTV